MHMDRMKVVDERVLNVAFQEPLQVTCGVSKNAFKPDKTPADEIVDQKSRDVSALAGILPDSL